MRMIRKGVVTDEYKTWVEFAYKQSFLIVSNITSDNIHLMVFEDMLRRGATDEGFSDE